MIVTYDSFIGHFQVGGAASTPLVIASDACFRLLAHEAHDQGDKDQDLEIDRPS